jgi:hypothetical protein
LAELRFVLRHSGLLDRFSILWAMPPTLFCFSSFSGRVSCFGWQQASDHGPPGPPCGRDNRNVPPCLAYLLMPGLFVESGLDNCSSKLASNCNPPGLCLLGN